VEVGGDLEADRLCRLRYFFCHDEGFWGWFGGSATGRAGGDATKCDGAESGGLPVADRTRTGTAASGRRTAGTGQGRQRVDGTQRRQDKGGGERAVRSGDRTKAAASGRRAAETGQGRQ